MMIGGMTSSLSMEYRGDLAPCQAHLSCALGRWPTSPDSNLKWLGGCGPRRALREVGTKSRDTPQHAPCERLFREGSINGATHSCIRGPGSCRDGNTTQTQIQLDDKVGVIVLTNTNDSNVGDIARQLAVTVGAAVAKAGAPKPVEVAWDPAWERFAGLYRAPWGDVQVVALNKKLVFVTPNGANVDSPTALEVLGGGRFRIVAPTGGGEVGEVVYFTEIAGKPMRFYLGDGYFDRVQ